MADIFDETSDLALAVALIVVGYLGIELVHGARSLPGPSDISGFVQDVTPQDPVETAAEGTVATHGSFAPAYWAEQTAESVDDATGLQADTPAETAAYLHPFTAPAMAWSEYQNEGSGGAWVPDEVPGDGPLIDGQII